MPTISAPATVLVTGANGFLGTHIIDHLLKAGFKVRAVVRDTKKGDYIQEKYPGTEYVLVKDMNAEGAYDHAVKDVDAVIHASSPVDLDLKGDPQIMIDEAVNGVIGVLNSASNPANGGKVRRIIQISSIVSVGNPTLEPVHYTESDWNDAVVEQVAKEGIDANPFYKYSASKTVAERKLWEWYRNNNKADFDVSVILPALMLGPPTEYPSANGEITTTNSFILPFTKAGIPDEALSQQLPNIADIRDVANASVLALQVPNAAGQRYILSAEPAFFNDVALVAGQIYPDRDINKGKPELVAELHKSVNVWDGTKAARELGFTYKARDLTIAEAYKAIDTRG